MYITKIYVYHLINTYNNIIYDFIMKKIEKFFFSRSILYNIHNIYNIDHGPSKYINILLSLFVIDSLYGINLY